MTNIVSCKQSYYTAAEYFVAGTRFRKTHRIGGKGRLWGRPISARAHVPHPPRGNGLHRAKRGQSAGYIAPALLSVSEAPVCTFYFCFYCSYPLALAH